MAWLQGIGFHGPSRADLQNGALPLSPSDTDEPNEFRHGWQFAAARARERFELAALERALEAEGGATAERHLQCAPWSRVRTEFATPSPAKSRSRSMPPQSPNSLDS